MVEDLQAELSHKEKKTGQKGVRENHSHIMLTAVALAPSLKSKAVKEIWEWIGIIESPKKNKPSNQHLT